MTGVSPLLRVKAWLSCVGERMGDEKVEPETLLRECEQRNGVIAGIRERLVCLLYFEKHRSTAIKCLDSSTCFATY